MRILHSNYTRGQTYAVVSYDPRIHVGDGATDPNDRSIESPVVINDMRSFWSYRRIFRDATKMNPRCYEAVFSHYDKEANPIFEAVRRLRMSPLDMAETVQGEVPDIDDVEQFVSGETETIEIAAAPAFMP